MKKIGYIFMCLLFSLTVKAQFIYNNEGGIVPFSKTEKYKSVINTSTVKTCILRSYNNDSLDNAKNKGNKGDLKTSGIRIDTLINLKSAASRYKIDEGTVWLYRIESKTAEMLAIEINPLVIPEGAYICIFPKNEELATRGPRLFLKKDIVSPDFWKYHYGNQLYIEYFEPNKVDKEANISISRIDYMFLSPFKKKVNTETIKDNTNGQLKSGYFGTAINACQYNVVCPEVSNWAKESRSIVYISAFIMTIYGNKNINGTGFFINKPNNYSDLERPFLMSAGHVFAPWDNANNVCYDLTNSSLVDFDFHINYRDEACNDPELRRGQSLPGNFNILTKGSSYNKKATDPAYEENEDYILLQSSTTSSELARNNILYAGWTAYPSFGNSGYAAIGHPNGDVQKVLIENDSGQIPSSGKSVNFFFDKGVTEGGFSGSPVFDSQKRVVGLICTSDNGSCALVGQNYVGTYCGNLNRIFWNISQYIAPSGQTLADESEPVPPAPPAHCKNCIKDLDETDIDCGGMCLPCGMRDAITIKSQADIVKNNIYARYELSTDPDPYNQIEFGSGDFNLTAGSNIKFTKNTVVKQGATLKATIKPALMSEGPRGCQDACVFGAPAFTPNGDGINDYWTFNQAFVTSYSLAVYNRWGGAAIYTKSNTPVYENGAVRAWDGTGVSSNGTYTINLTVTDCHGNTTTTPYFPTVAGLKSLDLSEFQAKLPGKDVNIEDDKTFRIIAYPNPTSGKVSVEASSSDLLFDYILTDMTGKVLVKTGNVLGSCIIDLSGFPSGLYLLRVKTDKNIQLCKLIKK